MKIDLEKAHAKVYWTFLKSLLLQINLNLAVANWVMRYVLSSSFEAFINASPFSFFNAARGLRQGCSLSHFIFILVVDSLSRLVVATKKEGATKGVRIA